MDNIYTNSQRPIHFAVQDSDGVAINLEQNPIDHIELLLPDETTLSLTMDLLAIVGEPAEGFLAWVPAIDDIELPGFWEAQAFVQVDGGTIEATRRARFEVFQSLTD